MRPELAPPGALCRVPVSVGLDGMLFLDGTPEDPNPTGLPFLDEQDLLRTRLRVADQRLKCERYNRLVHAFRNQILTTQARDHDVMMAERDVLRREVAELRSRLADQENVKLAERERARKEQEINRHYESALKGRLEKLQEERDRAIAKAVDLEHRLATAKDVEKRLLADNRRLQSNHDSTIARIELLQHRLELAEATTSRVAMLEQRCRLLTQQVENLSLAAVAAEPIASPLPGSLRGFDDFRSKRLTNRWSWPLTSARLRNRSPLRTVWPSRSETQFIQTDELDVTQNAQEWNECVRQIQSLVELTDLQDLTIAHLQQELEVEQRRHEGGELCAMGDVVVTTATKTSPSVAVTNHKCDSDVLRPRPSARQKLQTADRKVLT